MKELKLSFLGFFTAAANKLLRTVAYISCIQNQKRRIYFSELVSDQDNPIPKMLDETVALQKVIPFHRKIG